MRLLLQQPIWRINGNSRRSSPEISVDIAKKLAQTAVAMAKTSKPLSTELVSLVTEPVYANQTWVSDYEIDPFEVSDSEKKDRLADLSNRLLKSSSVNHTSAQTMYVKEQKHYADSYGTSTTQQRVRIQSQIESANTALNLCAHWLSLLALAGNGWEIRIGIGIQKSQSFHLY